MLSKVGDAYAKNGKWPTRALRETYLRYEDELDRLDGPAAGMMRLERFKSFFNPNDLSKSKYIDEWETVGRYMDLKYERGIDEFASLQRRLQRFIAWTPLPQDFRMLKRQKGVKKLGFMGTIPPLVGPDFWYSECTSIRQHRRGNHGGVIVATAAQWDKLYPRGLPAFRARRTSSAQDTVKRFLKALLRQGDFPRWEELELRVRPRKKKLTKQLRKEWKVSWAMH